MKTGLVSVSFRELEVYDIIKLAKKNSLKYIEWGGDRHVPMGNVRLAGKVKRLMDRVGIKCETYGSYYGIIYHKGEHKPLPFKKVLKTAKALGASKIRIWAGFPGCCENTEREIDKAVILTREMCREAKKYGIILSLECHFGTLTDDYRDTLNFINRVGYDNLKTYWQINPHKSFEYNMEAAKALLPYMTDVHVFYWKKNEKLPLENGADDWKRYIDILKEEDRIFFLEFMHDNKPESLPKTAETLHLLLKEE